MMDDHDIMLALTGKPHRRRGRPIDQNAKSPRAAYQRRLMRQLRIDHPEKYGKRKPVKAKGETK